jgi:hypothetical protein
MKKNIVLLIMGWVLVFAGCDKSDYDLPKPDGRLLGVTVDLSYVHPNTGETHVNVFEDFFAADVDVQLTLTSSKSIEKVDVVNSATAAVVGTINVNGGKTASFTYPVADMEIPFGQSSKLVFHVYFDDKGEDGFSYQSIRSFGFTVKDKIPSIVNFKKQDGTTTEIRGTEVNIEGYTEDPSKGVVGTFKPDVNSYIDLGDVSLLNFGADKDFSISFWVKSNHDISDPAMMGTMNWSSSNNVGWVIAWRNGRLRVAAGDGAGTKTDYRQDDTDAPMTDGLWHFVVVTFDRDDVSALYIDGELRASAPMVPVNIDAGVPTKINQDGTGSYGDKLGADYAQIYFYDYVLTQNDISAMWSAGK